MITTLATVKIVAQLTDRQAEGVPAGAGSVGESYLDTATGLTYVYNGTAWILDTSGDMLITMFIQKAEDDYLNIRGLDFDVVDEEIVYPVGSSLTGAEMVCYLSNLGNYEGRGTASEGLGGRSASYDQKINGYPMSIVGNIERFHSTK